MKSFFSWLNFGFKGAFYKRELKDLCHKYSIFHLIHLSKSKFFFVALLCLRLSLLLNLIILYTYCGSTFHIQVNFLGENLNEFFAWSHIGFSHFKLRFYPKIAWQPANQRKNANAKKTGL